MATKNQTKVFTKMIETVGSGKLVKMGKIIKESGYSEAMAKNPNKVTNSKGFQELLGILDDDKMLKRLNEIIFKGANRESLTGLDMGFKLKNRYPKEQTEMEMGAIKISFKGASTTSTKEEE